MQIAVIGATGMLGQPVTRELIWAGFSVRIIARDVEKARRFFSDTTVMAGDLNNVESLVNALSGVEVVYLNASIRQNEKKDHFHTEDQGLLNLIQASRLAGVRRIGYLSSIIIRYQGMNGFDWWVFEVKQKAVQLIKESGIPYSIFYPSCFLDSLNGTQRLGRFVLMVGRPAVKPWYISARDYGKQVAKAFRLAQGEQNQEYTIQGPEALTQHEAAKRFVAAYKKEKLVVLTTSPFLLQLGRLMSQQADYGLHITEALNNYPEVFEAARTWADLGKPLTTVEQFAAQV
ncbi:SDR family oxidoreductase [Spirosoma radiotolerans]|uniref:NmrA family transcriptional regulator n=1 Tax=Spirosoma radiotolerans TaxID=1379870 RepID=A0A0E3V796_9BACT|nr:NmrA family NAD(P)-binding protein [Spirosoma radiotolerans]AKD55226.1 NmrA family transcriptional regulator [Spirosoma radiotolerans]